MTRTPCQCGAVGADGFCSRAVRGEQYVRGRDCVWAWRAMHLPGHRERWGGDPAGCHVVHTPAPDPAPLRTVRLDTARLVQGQPRRGHADHLWHSNASVCRHGGRLLLAYRHRWAGADVWVTELDPDTYQPHGPGVKLDLRHPLAGWGREDPRLVEHAGRLECWFVGVGGKLGPCSQLYAVLRDDLSVERVYCPFPRRGKAVGEWVKNVNFFDHDGAMYAVHTIAPRHVIYRVDGELTEKVADTPGPSWSGGLPRGGAPPVLVGDQWISFFHGKVSWQGKTTYTCGVYRFRDRPPFEVTAVTPVPIMYGDSRTRPHDWSINNFFPCGAILEGQTWVVSAGEHDRHILIAEWDAKDICKAMKPVQKQQQKRPCGGC